MSTSETLLQDESFPGAQRNASLKIPHWVRVLLSLAIGLVLWEFAGRFIITDRLFFAPFSLVMQNLIALFADGTIYYHLYISGSEFVIGYAAAIVIGVLVGVLMGISNPLATFLDPWVSALYATPLVALTPLFILVFGIGVESKAALVFTLAVFPVLISTYSGMLSVDKNYLDVADSFSASSLQKIFKVLIPGALPFMISGFRLAVGKALTAVVVGELFFSSAGVGHLISISTQTFNSPRLFACVLIFSLSGVLLTAALYWLERRLAPWRSAA